MFISGLCIYKANQNEILPLVTQQSCEAGATSSRIWQWKGHTQSPYILDLGRKCVETYFNIMY